MGDILLTVFMIAFMFVLLFFIMAGLSKLFNTRITHGGLEIMNPKAFDDMGDLLKEGGKKIVNGAKSSREHINSLLKNKTKIEKLEKLADLKKNGFISDEEYDVLKKEVINDY